MAMRVLVLLCLLSLSWAIKFSDPRVVRMVGRKNHRSTDSELVPSTRAEDRWPSNPLAVLEEVNARHRAGQVLSLVEASSLSERLKEVTQNRALPYEGFVGSVCSCTADITHWLNSAGATVGFTLGAASCNTTQGYKYPLPQCDCHGLVINDCTQTTPVTAHKTWSTPLHGSLCNFDGDIRTEGECQGDPCQNKGTRRVTVHKKATISVDSASSSQRTKVTCVREVYEEPCTTAAACDCQMGDWQTWGSCVTKTGCGEGIRERSRPVLTAALNGGSCEPLQSEPCTGPVCKVDCNFTWGEWSACSETCGEGLQSRQKNVTVQPSGGGASCGILEETRGCNLGPCVCQMSNFSQWSDCSAPCVSHEGHMPTQTRTRTVLKSGTGCGLTLESRSCNTHWCDRDCSLSPWSNWTSCTKSCGSGTMMRTRSVEQPATGQGNCNATEEIQSCNTQPCPVDCQLSTFSEWNECSALCGEGVQSRQALVLVHPQHGGAQCPPTIQQRVCKINDCPVNCQLGNWSNWTSCSQECGGGVRERWRDVLQQPSGGGTPCLEATHETSLCNTHQCPRDCLVSNWSAWDQCTASCGGGQQSRTRSIVETQVGTGSPCPITTESKQCATQACPQDCVMNTWSEWSTCAGPCGDGLKQRVRNVVTPSANGGVPCNGTVEMAECVHDNGCSPECVLSNWSAWTKCSKTCGGGERTRSRVVQELRNGATASQCGVLSETETCGVVECPTNCRMSNWSSWSNCSASCGGGIQSRSRTVEVANTGGGAACGETIGYQECNADPCPTNCVLSQWGPWGPCSASCGNGTRTRTRSVAHPAHHGGQPCGKTEDVGFCNANHCPIDGQWSLWSEWSACSLSCGGGLMQRIRVVAVQPQFGGKPVEGDSRELKACNTLTCPSACEVTSWSEWGLCSATCGGGHQTRSRSVTKQPVGGGELCPLLNETRPCGNSSCPVDCQLSAWSGWSECQGGVQKRTRSVVTPPKGQGVSCGALEETQPCEVPTDCMVTPFSEFSDCSVSCGNGTQVRVRNVHREPRNGGRPCPQLQETRECSMPTCNATTPLCSEPTRCNSCQHLAWSGWSPCHPPCTAGGDQDKLTVGIQQRVRKVHAGPDHCKPVVHQRPCQLEAPLQAPTKPDPGVNCVHRHVL